MGLDVCLCVTGWGFRAGSYGGFNTWRTMLAQVVDIDLQEMNGYKDWGRVKGIEWTGNEPFYWLLDHSDCEGEIWDVEELYNDFAKYRDKAHEMWVGHDSFLEKYDKWMQLCKDANEQGGFIRFG